METTNNTTNEKQSLNKNEATTSSSSRNTTLKNNTDQVLPEVLSQNNTEVDIETSISSSEDLSSSSSEDLSSSSSEDLLSNKDMSSPDNTSVNTMEKKPAVRMDIVNPKNAFPSNMMKTAVNTETIFLSVDDVKGKKKEAAQQLQKKYTSNTKTLKQSNSIEGTQLPITRFIGSGGEIVDLGDYQNKKIVLVILRGFAGGICLACSAQTLALSESVEKFVEKNAQIILVYPGKAESIPKFTSVLERLKAEFEPPFPIVLDVDLALVKQLTIVGSLAKPTSMIVTPNGKVEYAYIGKTIIDRPSVATLLEEIDRLSGK